MRQNFNTCVKRPVLRVLLKHVLIAQCMTRTVRQFSDTVRQFSYMYTE